VSSDRWEKLQQIFIAALQQEPGERVLFARQACRGDASLRAEVESLLRSYDEEPGFLKEAALGTDAAEWILRNLKPSAEPNFGENAPRDLPEAESPAPAFGGAAAGVARGPARHPAAIGRYRILRLVGEGGMGTVYEAEQEQPRRIVALKVIKPGLASPDLLWRFQQESQALARLQHPGIAQIYEAGAEDSGAGLQPFFAMEFIRGQPIVDYADEHHLNTRQRLELMAKVCEAVHHAHQRGLIHRDLKPGNILVDEAGQPKILDFGVARVTDSDVEATQRTDVGQLVGTLAYMSPEQVLADPLALDTRSDVYALGVILYQLLAGRLPYQVSPKVHEAVRTIQEDDPAPLSSINRSYRGDVETIVSKALEKDKARRYASAADLGGDIRRYLQDEPIIARPASAIYQLEKFARRHKALVTAIAVVFVVLVAGIIVSTREAVLARQAEQTAQAVNDFLQNDLLAQANAAHQSGPSTKPDPHLEVRTALDRAAARIAGKFDRQPEVEAAIRDTIGQTYEDLGQYPEARKHLERALDLHRKVLGAENPKTLATMRRLAATAQLQGKYPEAEALLKQTLQIQRRVLGPEHPDTLDSMNSLAITYLFQGKYAQAEALYSQTLEIQRRVLGPEHPDTLISMNNLADAYVRQGKYPEAEALLNQTLEIKRRMLGPQHPATLNSMNGLAVLYFDQGKYTQAEALHSQTLEIKRSVLGPEHPDTLATMLNLANSYYEQGKYAPAEALFKQTLEIKRRVLGLEHLDTLGNMNNLADAYYQQGKYEQAEVLFNQTLEISRRVLGSENPYTLSFLSEMAGMYQRQGKYDKAEAYATQSLTGLRRSLGPENPDTMVAAADLALAYQSKGKFAESEPLARQAVAFDRKRRPDDWQRFRAESLLGASLAGQKKYDEAEPLLLGGYQGMAARKERIGVPDWYHLDRARDEIVQLYVDWGKPEKAAEWRKAPAGH
jgi:eukaryotic-like serine/threonine-protein kinase